MHENSSDNVFHFYLRSIVHNLKHLMDDRLIPYGITNQQARLVGYISSVQGNNKTICQKDIESEMGLRGSSVTSLLQGLERKGLIRRSSGVVDARTKEISLTPKGQSLIDEFQEIFRATEDKLVLGMTEQQKQTFLQLLQLVAKNVEK